ncbi:mycothione reductase [Leucobacter allii]|uniref:Mycothione reductase n=1 Tax=Leucobacter allii TaxID=2932247 RepID=A0ABY4FNT3_9MICO|nr:mycothione reductase [Leucobacter allii]UOQ57931.1 mycothione reductase [Leucobacter allii]UOR02563.1 mycothione reductase [Leucobacter allii]
MTTSSTLAADLAIIGSGSGNSLLTPFWDERRVVIAEQGVFGGTCLNVGCIPTKMYVRPAALARSPEEAARLGVTLRTEAVDWPAIRDRIFSRIDAISAAGERFRRDEQEHVTLLSQRVTLTGPRSFEAADGTRVEAEQLVIAAGSRAVLPEIPGIGLPQVHTSDTVMRLPELPRRVLVIGGGYIACEFAGVFSGLGAEVVQVQRGERLLRQLDADVSTRFTAEAARRWELRLERTVARIDAGPDGGVVASLARPDGSDTAETIAADVVLVALGRRPNSDLVGAAEAGLDLHPDGRIAVDAAQRVLSGGRPVPGLYALGDVCSAHQLKHVANHEARVVAHNLEHPGALREARHDAIPAAVFSDPEIAVVGLTEAEAVREIGAEHVTVKTQQYGDTAYGWAMEDTTGMFKVVADRRDGRILGAHVLGYQASNLIQVVVSAMSFGIDAHTAARGQYWIHPALMEVAENALLGLDVPQGPRPPL